MLSVKDLDGNGVLWTADATDKFNRLTDIETDGRETYSIFYDNLGNVKSKYDAGTMRYGNANPYAVDKIYDVHDITLFAEPQDVKYSSFDKAIFISQGENSLEICYGADRQRVRQTISTSNTEETKRYFTALYEEVTEKGTKKINPLSHLCDRIICYLCG